MTYDCHTLCIEALIKEIKTMDNLQQNLAVLNKINFEIAGLAKEKVFLEKSIVKSLGHDESSEGQKTYEIDKYKAIVKTGFNYRVVKEEFELLRSRVPECFNPVVISNSYRVDSKKIKDIQDYADEEETNLVYKFILKTPKKLHLQLMAAV